MSVVIVSHNRAEMLRRCLGALERSEGREAYQVTVVDNGSRDGSADMEQEFPWVRFMRLPHNFGLTKALNIGIRGAAADYLLLLHEDTEPAPDMVKELAAALDARQDAGAAAPLLVDAEGHPAPQVGDFPPDGEYQPAEPGPEPLEVDYASGAALMFRSFFFKAMRMIDERYGQFGPDAELSFRIRNAGKKILILPAARAVHHGRAGDSPEREIDLLTGAAVFAGKHFGFMAGLKARVRAVFGALGRFQLGRVIPLISGQKIDGTQG